MGSGIPEACSPSGLFGAAPHSPRDRKPGFKAKVLLDHGDPGERSSPSQVVLLSWLSAGLVESSRTFEGSPVAGQVKRVRPPAPGDTVHQAAG